MKSKLQIEQTIKHIEVLNNFVKDAFTNVYKSLENCEDADTYVKNNKVIHDKLNDEMQRQIQLLDSLLHKVIKPTDAELKSFLKNNKDFETLAEVLLPFDIDTTEASDKLAIAFTSLNKLQYASEKVKKALDDVNMNMDNYIKTTSLPELNEEFLKHLHQKGNSADLNKIVAAITVLRTNFKDRKDITEYIKKEGKGVDGGAIKIESIENVSSELGRVKGSETKSTLLKNIKKSNNTMKELYGFFLKEFNSRFNNIKESISNMTESINNNISTDEHFLLFVDAYQNLGEIENKSMFPSLIGIGEQMNSKEMKENFIATIKQLIEICDKLGSSNFKSIQDNLKSVLDIIDTFTELIQSSKTVKLGKAEGGAMFDHISAIGDENLMASTNIVTDTISKIKFLGNVAKIKKNLSNLSGFYEETKKNYDELLGKTIGFKLNQIHDFHQSTIKSIDDKTNGIGYLIQEYNDGIKIATYINTILTYSGNAALAAPVPPAAAVAASADRQAFINAVKTLTGISDSNSFIKELNSMGVGWNTVAGALGADNVFVNDAISRYQIFLNLTPIDPDFLKSFSNLQYEAREGLYKAMEAIDLYLINFTEAIASDPDAINSLDKILNSTQIITKFYTNKTGNNLAELFDNFSVPMARNQNFDYNEMDANLDQYMDAPLSHGFSYVVDNKDIKKIFDKCKESLDGFSALKNILSAFFFIGDKFNNKSVKDTIHMSPNLIFKNLQKYIVVSAFSNHMYNIDLLNFDYTNPFGNDAATAANKYTNKTKYLALFFTFMMNNVEIQNGTVANTTLDNHLITNDPESLQLGIQTSPYNAAPVAERTAFTRMFKHTVKLQAINKKTNIFAKDDENFIHTMHAVASKIFTTVGTYSLLKDPVNKGDILTNPSRLIIGGANEIPMIDSKLVEYYIRLPLLVEFYRNIFDKGNDTFKNNITGNQSEQIAYIPDVNGVWSKLIAIIFDKSKHLNFGTYDKSNLHGIIYEINKIAKVFEGKTIHDCVENLVFEVNRRYGVLKKKDIEDYYKTVKSFEEGTQNINESLSGNTNFDTLNADGDVDSSAPSDKYKRSFTSISNINARSMAIDDFQLLKDFRNKINTELNKVIAPPNDPLYKSSFREYIKIIKNDVENAVSNEKKFEIVTKGLSNANDEHMDNMDHYILFHELVVTPLALLNSQYHFIGDTITRIHAYLSSIKTIPLPNAMPAAPGGGAAYAAPVAFDYNGVKTVYDGEKQTFETAKQTYENNPNIAGALTTFNTAKERFDIISTFYNVFEFDHIYNNANITQYIRSAYRLTIPVGAINNNLNRVVFRLLSTIFNLKSINSELVKNDLINIKFLSNGSLMIDYSKYQDVVESLLNNVKDNINKFRTIINKSILNKYMDIKTPGSIYYLEDKFLNKCLKNKQNEQSNDEERYLLNFNSLTVLLKNLVPYVKPNNVVDRRRFNINDKQLFSTLIAEQIPDLGGAVVVTNITTIPLYRDMFRHFVPTTKQWTILNDHDVLNMTIMPNVNVWENESDYGIVTSFNRLMNSYLTTFYDQNNKKIYQNLLTNITNNTIPNMTNLGDGFNDISYPVIGANGAVARYNLIPLSLPTNNIIISGSLSYILKTLVSRTINPNVTDTKLHLWADLNAIPQHTLELMKTQLPIFVQLFTILMKKSLYYRQILLNNDFTNDCNTRVVNTPSVSLYMGIDNSCVLTGWDHVIDKNERTQRYKAILDNVVECCNDVIKDITNVINELNVLDNNKVPMFMDIKKDFIRNYQSITNNVPFTPISQISTTFNTVDTDTLAILTGLGLNALQTRAQNRLKNRFREIIPNNQIINNNNVKFQHGIQLLFSNNNITLENAPYMKELLKKI